MFSWFRKKADPPTPPAPTVLTVSSGGRDLFRITTADVPAERTDPIELVGDNPDLSFTDSAGQIYRHDLSSAKAEGFTWLHPSIRVSANFAAEADGLLSQSRDPKVAQEEFARGGKAIRFQPIYLPECPADPADLVGKGFFYRGLHFQGTITPGNVSLGCICDQCRQSFRLQGFHAGFMDVTYFFCSNGPHTLIVSSHVEGTPPLLQVVEPEAVAPLEAQLPACTECSGNFRYLNPFLCPHCKAPYIDFARYPMLRMTEYYGCTLYSDSAQHWEP